MNATEKRIILPFFRKVSACSVRALSLEALSLLRRYGEKRRKPSLRKAEKEEKKLGKKGRWEAVKAAVRARAQGLCECGCGGWAIVMDPDHFYGKRQETVQTVWQLNRSCHDDKTHNYPVRRYWDDKFKAHCAKYGYDFKPRLTKQLTGSKE